jgi:hypothetical protein
MKKLFLIFPLLLITLVTFAVNVNFSWTSVVQPSFYTLYWGPSSYFYTNSINVQTNECTVSNLLANTIYYFAATETIGSSTSLYSRQLIIGPNPVGTSSLYLDSEIVYGGALNSLQTNIVELECFNGNNPNIFFGGNLIINPNPFFNMNTAGDNATYLAEQITWGDSLFDTVTDTIPVFTDLNIGNFYSSSILITNQSL